MTNNYEKAHFLHISAKSDIVGIGFTDFVGCNWHYFVSLKFEFDMQIKWIFIHLTECLARLTGSENSTHFFNTVKRQKYSILNWVFETQSRK